MSRNRKLASIPLLIVGIAFINLGLFGGERRALLGIGVVFVIVGVAVLLRRGKP